jgi:hypothetical protein
VRPIGAPASWSNESGTHTMRLRQAVTKLPEAKPHVVTAQIHDEDDDVVMVRLEGTQLEVEYDDGRARSSSTRADGPE